MKPKLCFHDAPPGVDLARLSGKLIVLESQDGAGRSTHVRLLTEWLEQKGYAVTPVGLKRSMLVGHELERAKTGNTLSPRTLSLFYAADFYDQLENVIVPALHSGGVVLSDRYVFTLMARDLVRGAEPHWVESLYSRALVPDAVFYLKASPETLTYRTLKAHGQLEYWESGMDLGLSRDWFECFLLYQERMARVFKEMMTRYGFARLDANRSVDALQKDLRGRLRKLLEADASGGA
jgi:dTMP kinase